MRFALSTLVLLILAVVALSETAGGNLRATEDVSQSRSTIEFCDWIGCGMRGSVSLLGPGGVPPPWQGRALSPQL